MRKASPALIAYVMSNDEDQVRAAREAINADLADGKPVFSMAPLTAREQREAGMLPPTQRQAETSAATVAEPKLAGLDDKSLDKLEDLVQAERERRWNTDADTLAAEDTTQADLENYEAVTDNPLSQAAVDAMDQQQRDIFIKSGMNATGVPQSGKPWEGGSGKWQRGETV